MKPPDTTKVGMSYQFTHAVFKKKAKNLLGCTWQLSGMNDVKFEFPELKYLNF